MEDNTVYLLKDEGSQGMSSKGIIGIYATEEEAEKIRGDNWYITKPYKVDGIYKKTNKFNHWEIVKLKIRNEIVSDEYIIQSILREEIQDANGEIFHKNKYNISKTGATEDYRCVEEDELIKLV